MRDYRLAFDEHGMGTASLAVRDALDLPTYRISRRQTLAEALQKRHLSTYLTPEGVVIIHQTFATLTDQKPRAAFRQIPWDDLTGIDLRGYKIRLIGPSGATNAGTLFSPKQLGSEWSDYLANLQLKGVIPSRISVVSPEERNRASKRGAWAFPVAFWILFIGVPLYVGAGSLASAALPGIADIAPEAVELAILRNPQWPFAVRADLISNAVIMSSLPSAALPVLLGINQNSAASLMFIPVWWCEKFCPRSWQVQTMAGLIERQVAAQSH